MLKTIILSWALSLMFSVAYAQKETKMNTLTPRQLHLAVCACLEAQGDMPRLNTALRKALDGGVTVNELKEAFSQLYAYTGFPRSLNALNLLAEILEDRRSKGIRDSEGKPWKRPLLWGDGDRAKQRGTEVQTRLCGGEPYNYTFSPQNDYYLKAHLFGDIFAGDILSEADREWVTVAALSGMQGVEKQLESHLRGAVTMGNSAEQVEELCRYLCDNGLSVAGSADAGEAGAWPQGEPNVHYAAYFKGNSYLAPIQPKNLSDGEQTVQAYSNVTFEPGCRNNWHVHHGARQVLICVGGKGWYQEWGRPAVSLQAGDIIDIPEGVKHWHGARQDSWFRHLVTHASTGGEERTEWMEEVSDRAYERVHSVGPKGSM